MGSRYSWRSTTYEADPTIAAASGRLFGGNRDSRVAVRYVMGGRYDELVAWTFAAMCVASGPDVRSPASAVRFDLIASEPTSAVAPLTTAVELQGASATPQAREHVLLARQVGIPAFEYFYPGGSGLVNFRVENVETNDRCILLPPFVRRTDVLTGQTRTAAVVGDPVFKGKKILEN